MPASPLPSVQRKVDYIRLLCNLCHSLLTFLTFGTGFALECGWAVSPSQGAIWLLETQSVFHIFASSLSITILQYLVFQSDSWQDLHKQIIRKWSNISMIKHILGINRIKSHRIELGVGDYQCLMGLCSPKTKPTQCQWRNFPGVNTLPTCLMSDQSWP